MTGDLIRHLTIGTLIPYYFTQSLRGNHQSFAYMGIYIAFRRNDSQWNDVRGGQYDNSNLVAIVSLCDRMVTRHSIYRGNGEPLTSLGLT